ncbi:MAG: deoxyribose-phosphate aldolase [bacterium]|nr:deoxyribose-phosphate aldolase [bacterium]
MGFLNTSALASRCVSKDGECTSCGYCATEKPEAIRNILSSGADRIGAKSGIAGGKVDNGVAGMIDHTLLKPEASREELVKVCEEAKQFSFATVCVNSCNIPLVARLLKGSTVKPIAVVGFPLGAASSQSKAFESKEAIRAGAREIDMVVNIGALKSKDYKLVFEDIKAVVDASAPHKVKVIIEASNLNDEQKIVACALSKTAGAAFVKTSTGFGKGGATIADVELMRRVVGDDMEVKASGGIRTKEDVDKMIKAGANRVGASASVAIVTGKKASKGNY